MNTPDEFEAHRLALLMARNGLVLTIRHEVPLNRAWGGMVAAQLEIMRAVEAFYDAVKECTNEYHVWLKSQDDVWANMERLDWPDMQLEQRQCLCGSTIARAAK